MTIISPARTARRKVSLSAEREDDRHSHDGDSLRKLGKMKKRKGREELSGEAAPGVRGEVAEVGAKRVVKGSGRGFGGKQLQ